MGRPKSCLRAAEEEKQYLTDRAAWAERMFALCTKYADTPPGFSDEEIRRRAAERLAAWRQECTDAASEKILTPSFLADTDGIVWREGVLKTIRSAFEDGCSPVILYGMGGVGKSSLAEAYASRFGDRYAHVLRLGCERGLQAAFGDDTALRISGASIMRTLCRTEKEYVRNKLSAFSRVAARERGRILLILDNCDFLTDPLLKKIFALPAALLVTTRTNPSAFEGALPGNWKGVFISPDGFETEQEWENFAASLGAGESWRAVREEKRGNILEVKLALLGSAPGSGDRNLLGGSFSAAEKAVLRLLAVMPSGGTPGALVSRLVRGGSRAAASLKKRGIVGTRGEILVLHPLLREAVCREMKPAPANMAGAIRALADAAFNAWERTWEENLSLTPYVLAMVRAFVEPPAHLVREFDIFVTLLWIQGHCEEAMETAKRLYDACLGRYGLQHELTGFAALRAGAAYGNAGNLSEAEEWYVLAYRILMGAPASTPCMALYRIEANDRMGLCAARRGDFEEALQYNEVSLHLADMLRRDYPDRLPGYRGNPALEYPYKLLERGGYYFEKGDFEEAEHCGREAYEALLRIDFAPYREVEFLRLKARVLLQKGAHDEALSIAGAMLEKTEKYRGEHSREMVRAQELCADILLTAGRSIEAAGLYERAMGTLITCYPAAESWIEEAGRKWRIAAGH